MGLPHGKIDQDECGSEKAADPIGRTGPEFERRRFDADQRVVLDVLVRIDRVIGKRSGNAAGVKEEGSQT